jgi:hypothetical protein
MCVLEGIPELGWFGTEVFWGFSEQLDARFVHLRFMLEIILSICLPHMRRFIHNLMHSEVVS